MIETVLIREVVEREVEQLAAASLGANQFEAWKHYESAKLTLWLHCEDSREYDVAIQAYLKLVNL